MINNASRNWLVDLNNLTCSNTENHVVVVFEKKWPALIGKIKYIPIDLVEKLTRIPDKEDFIRKSIIEADEVFYRAYFNNERKRK